MTLAVGLSDTENDELRCLLYVISSPKIHIIVNTMTMLSLKLKDLLVLALVVSVHKCAFNLIILPLLHRVMIQHAWKHKTVLLVLTCTTHICNCYCEQVHKLLLMYMGMMYMDHAGKCKSHEALNDVSDYRKALCGVCKLPIHHMDSFQESVLSDGKHVILWMITKIILLCVVVNMW